MAFKSELLLHKITMMRISQVRLASMLGVTPRTINRWLRGDQPPKNSHIKALANALHCRPEDFDPRYAESENDIHVEARISASSHNAFATIRAVYGVDEQTIIELAPALFSIVAARASNLPAEDAAFWASTDRQARALGLRVTHYDNIGSVEGLMIDELAAQTHRCFGLKSPDGETAHPRNLFVEAMRRIAHEAGPDVSMIDCDQVPAGEPPASLGFNPHTPFYRAIAAGDEEIVRKLARGQVRLSQSFAQAELEDDKPLPEKAEIIRRDLLAQADQHRQKLEEMRGDSLNRLGAWRAFYEEGHPDLAKEYDELVSAFGKPEGWYPDHYSSTDREQDYADPFAETRFLDYALLPKPQDSSKRPALWLPSVHAHEAQRFAKLKNHRRLSKVEFEKIYQ